MNKLNVADPTHTANDLHHIILEAYELYNIESMEIEIIENMKSILGDYYESRMIETKSFDMKTSMMKLSTDPEKSDQWDTFWHGLQEKYNYHEFSMVGFLHRNTFKMIRRSYLMPSVCNNVLEEDPKTFGISQMLCEKYIEDVLLNSYPNQRFKIFYENFDGVGDHIIVQGGEKEWDYPESHWVGKTIFDSFYMMPLFNSEENKMQFIPVDLIRNIKMENRSPYGDGENDVF